MPATFHPAAIPLDTIISVDRLRALQYTGRPLCVLDASFNLTQPDWGRQQFEQARIPGSRYIHLEEHLSGHNPATRASGGRHPLPSREEFAATLTRLGVQPDQQIVVYDRNNGNFCGRAWWMLQWLGHPMVAVLDGGLQAWQKAGWLLESGPPAPVPPAGAPFWVREPLVKLHSTDDVRHLMHTQRITLVDARTAPRYRGEIEMLDRVAGHIPGAINRPFGDNFDEEGHFKSADKLWSEFKALLPIDSQPVTVYCGSGVSAIPNILAMRIAGLPTPALFAGSWSEWSSHQPPLPIATGASPGQI